MALTLLKPIIGRGGEWGARVRADYTRPFAGISNNPLDTEISIRRSPLLARWQPGAPDPDDPAARIIRLSIRETGRRAWQIDVTTSTEYERNDESPLDEPAHFSIQSDRRLIYTTRDRFGKPILTKAYSLLPVQKYETAWAYRVTKNVRSIPAAILNLNDKVNNSSIYLRGMLIAKGKLMVAGMQGEDASATVYGQSLRFVKMSFELHYQREGWIPWIPNVDLFELGPGAFPERDDDGRIQRVNAQTQYRRIQNARRRIIDERTGRERSEPWPLDAQGRALPADYRPDQIVYLRPEIAEEASFYQLPLT